jgi:hypothetical protein
MNDLDLSILNFLSTRDNWENYGKVVDKGLCNKLSWQLVQDINEYYTSKPTVSSIVPEDFSVWMNLIRHPDKKSDDLEMYNAVIKNAVEREPVSDEFLSTLKEAKIKSELAHLADDLSAGRVNMDEYFNSVSHLQPSANSVDDYDVNVTLIDIADRVTKKEGLYWRLEDLNRSVGPINKGDFIVIGKRPETGGTSFLCSESTFMFEQMDQDVLLINNEEDPSKLVTRMMTTALDVDYRTLIANPTKYHKDYLDWLDERSIRIKHKSDASITDIRRWLESGDYGLLGVNVLMKLAVPGKLEDHDKLQYIGENLRALATSHCPIMGIQQADPTADGVKYIHQDKLYKSKTALQGEADVLLMIGLDYNEPEDRRYFHVAKNKLPPAACTMPNMKHAMVEVGFDGPTGRFYSTLFKGAHSWTKK